MQERRLHSNGGLYERDATGVWRLVSAAPTAIQTKPADPTLPFKVTQEQNQAAASAYDPAKAAAEAAAAQAKAPYAGTVAGAEAQKAVADAAKAQAELEIARAKSKGKPVEEAQAELRRIIGQIDAIAADANDNGGWFETGYTGSFNRERPGTAAFDLARAISTIDANSAFSKLAQMRAESPTGGAIGNVTERELDLLKSTISSLDPDQGHESFLKSLKTAREHYAGMLGRIGGEAPQPDVTAAQALQIAPATGGIVSQNDPENTKRLDAMIRAGVPHSEANAWAVGQGANPIDPSVYAAAVAYAKKNPSYKGALADFSRQSRTTAVQRGIGKIADSALGAYGVASANALTAGTLDEIAGATGGDQQQAQFAKEVLRAQHPGASLAGDITGSALGMTGLNGGLRFMGGRLGGLATRGGGIGGDALYGAAFGAGESNDNRLTGAGLGALSASAGNLAGRGIVSGIGRSVRGVDDANVGYLANRGVRMTPGQILGQGGMFGRGVRAVEDSLESVPFLGSAIRSRKVEGLRDFNREAFRDALGPINEQVQGTIGQEAMGEAQDFVSNAYTDALNGVTLRADLPFVQQAGQAVRAGRAVPEFGQDVDYLARTNLGPAFGPGRTLTGEGLQSSLQDIASTTADFRKAGNVRGRNAANAMGDLRQSYFDLANRQAPETVPGLQAANTANRNVSILGDAVTGAVNNSVESGLFSPAQLGRAAVNNTKKFGGKRSAARGDVPFAELQEAGQAVLPNVVPNSGTTDRALATLVLPAALGGSAIGAEQLGAPAPVAIGLGAIGALSTRRGNDLVQNLLTSRSPEARRLGTAIMHNVRAGGMFGGSIALPTTFNQ